MILFSVLKNNVPDPLPIPSIIIGLLDVPIALNSPKTFMYAFFNFILTPSLIFNIVFLGTI